jgi:hypothetical protein
MIDFKEKIMFLMNDPKNEKEIRQLERLNDYRRFRTTAQRRFNSQITRPLLKAI